MRAITVQQPMATAILHHGKTVENRSRIDNWRGLTGETIAIHAGKKWNPEYAETVHELTGHHYTPDTVTLGAIIGLARITDVHWERDDCCEPWGHAGLGVVHIALDLARPIQPIYCRGNLGAWPVPAIIRRELDAVRP